MNLVLLIIYNYLFYFFFFDLIEKTFNEIFGFKKDAKFKNLN